MDSALVGVIVGGLIGLSTQILTAIIGRRQRWEEARRQVYVTYLERVSLSRRRLQKQVENKLAGLPTYDAEAKERREAREVTIAGWNQVRLMTRSSAVAGAALELQVRVATLNEILEGEREATESALEEVIETYERNRNEYVSAVQIELGLATWSDRFRRRTSPRAF